jgi:hypothetical protein
MQYIFRMDFSVIDKEEDDKSEILHPTIYAYLSKLYYRIKTIDIIMRRLQTAI